MYSNHKGDDLAILFLKEGPLNRLLLMTIFDNTSVTKTWLQGTMDFEWFARKGGKIII